ncbi:hypothetical protein MKL42_18680 [Acinetobacter sp. AOR15_HL]|uniref:hypothetical protein n=1 Tax=unclassified Acinetobacter TaxID=196816 RepID=UPI0022EB83D5|nr:MULTISPECIES: hypothetical protein [unclassified Acinetobacter]MDA3559486.1 hypothetical protein [Acinetobacter sp. AOR15_HL]MDA3573823.1 hypothetical protein [Acinetobacter sp. AOR14_HL]
MQTLKNRIEKELKETLYKNKIYQKTRWNVLERNIILWSTNYKKYTVLISIYFVLISWLIYFLIKLEITKSYSDFFLSWKELISWQSTFLGAQLTIVCVVYPLVISFISIFSNQKTSNSVIFPIYKKYSGFMFAGLSGLALSIFILISFFIRSFLVDSIYLVFCITSAIWLIFNIFLTAWFFSKTFLIMNDHSREEIILRFSIQEACRIDISKRLKNNFIKNAPYYGLIKEFDTKKLKLLSFSWDDSEILPIEIKIKNKYELINIRFYLINLVIYLQTNYLKYRKKQDQKLIWDIREIGDEFYLIGKTKGFSFLPCLEFLYNYSFSFNKKIAIESDEELLNLFKNFIDPIHLSLRDNDIRAFKETIGNLIDYHVNVASALEFFNDNKRNDNWLLLTDGSIFGRSYFNNLLVEYFIISKASVFKIIDNTEFYNEILYFHKRLYGYRSSLTDEEIKTHIEQNYNLWEILLEWYSFEINRNPRTDKNYEEILNKFVGSWESWIQYIEPPLKRDYKNEQTLLAFKTHLQFTAKTIIAALSFKNSRAVGWSIDMLNHWLEKFTSRSTFYDSYMWNSTILNISMLNIPETDFIWNIITGSEKYSRETAYQLAFQNYHFDLRLITACYLLKKSSFLSIDIIKEMIDALLMGRRIHPTSISENLESISNAGKLVETYIRHRDYSQSKENSYQSLLNQIIENYSNLFKDQLITGRTYMGSVEGVNSLKDSYIEIALSLSKNQWDLSSKFYQLLSTKFYNLADINYIILDLESWIFTLNKWQEENYKYILFEDDVFSDLKENFIKSIENIIEKLKNKNNKSIIDAPIDPEKILALSKIASSIIQDKKASYPFNLFEFIESKSNDFKSGIFTFENYEKKYIADGVTSEVVINEEEWIKDGILRHLKKSIISKILKLPISYTYSSTSIEEILQVITVQISEIEEPILLVGNQKLKNILRRYKWNKNEAMPIHFKNSSNDGYICHIGECEVYDLFFDDIDYILLTSKSIFESLSFYQYKRSEFFDVLFDLKNPNDLTGDLVFKYEMALKFKENYKIFRFNLNIVNET